MTVKRLVAATKTGIRQLAFEDGAWREKLCYQEELGFTCVAASGDLVIAGSADGRLFRSEDGGQTWAPSEEKLPVRRVRWVMIHPVRERLAFAGTEKAALFVSKDGGESWCEVQDVARYREEYQWSLPYSPEAGCVRGFAVLGARIYAAVEVGGLLRSDDYGDHWRFTGGSVHAPGQQPGESELHPDVHSVEVHPSSPDLVLAPTGGGFFRSADGGASWENLYRCYCRAVWADAGRPDRMVLGPADGVSRNGRIEYTLDGGRTWEMAPGLTDAPWERVMVERFAELDDHLVAVLSNGRMLTASKDELHWKPLPTAAEGIKAVAAASPSLKSHVKEE